VTCIDLPGHGQSAPCDEFTLANISDLLVNAVEAENSCWLGWSLGATVVLDLAVRYPERVNSLILLAGNPKFVQSPVEMADTWPGMASDVFDSFVDTLNNDCYAALEQFLSLQVYGSSGAKTTLRQLVALLSGYEISFHNILHSALALLKASDMRTVLGTLEIPVSMLLGTQDKLVPAGVGQALRDSYPTVQVNIIEAAGHALFLSHQQEALAIVRRFMDAR
jgi:pimeloyl-[acyl-carrier protein] methyl ester esterase